MLDVRQADLPGPVLAPALETAQGNAEGEQVLEVWPSRLCQRALPLSEVSGALMRVPGVDPGERAIPCGHAPRAMADRLTSARAVRDVNHRHPVITDNPTERFRSGQSARAGALPSGPRGTPRHLPQNQILCI